MENEFNTLFQRTTVKVCGNSPSPPLESHISHLSISTNNLCCMAGNIRRKYRINL